MKLETITDIVKADGMSEVGVEQGDNVTPRRETARLGGDACLGCQFGNQMRWNEVANLAQGCQLGSGWFAVFVFVHPC